MSVNQRRMKRTSRSSQIAATSWGVFGASANGGSSWGRGRRRNLDVSRERARLSDVVDEDLRAARDESGQTALELPEVGLREVGVERRAVGPLLDGDEGQRILHG